MCITKVLMMSKDVADVYLKCLINKNEQHIENICLNKNIGKFDLPHLWDNVIKKDNRLSKASIDFVHFFRDVRFSHWGQEERESCENNERVAKLCKELKCPK